MIISPKEISFSRRNNISQEIRMQRIRNETLEKKNETLEYCQRVMHLCSD